MKDLEDKLYFEISNACPKVNAVSSCYLKFIKLYEIL